MAFPADPLDVLHELQLGEPFLGSGYYGANVDLNLGACVSRYKSSFDITGDIDIRMEMTLDDWSPTSTTILAARNRGYGLTAGANFSWSLNLTSTGALILNWSTTGLFGGILNATSTTGVSFTNGQRGAIRVTLDVNNGSGGRTTTFYTSSSIDGSWTMLGSAVTVAATTSITSGVADLEIGSQNDGVPGDLIPQGRIHAFELMNGIAGTTVAKIDFSRFAPGSSSFTDLVGNSWQTTSNIYLMDADWVDVTSDTYGRGAVSITRGRSGEGSIADTSICSTQLNNRTGKYSPRNPSGTYFGRIGRNTRERVSLPGSAHLWSNGGSGIVYCDDSAGISVTGDLDIRWDGEIYAWKGVGESLLIHKLQTGQLSYGLSITDSGTLKFYWSSDGTNALSAESTQFVPRPWSGRKAVRATIDVNNGAAGRTVTFYTSDTIAGSWTTLGSAVVQAGTTSIANTTSELVVETYRQSPVYAASVLSGIAGSTVASPTFTSQTAGVRSFTDAQSNVWRLSAEVEISTRDTRFWGEVAAWPQRWDTSGTDVWSPIQGSGVMRRLGANQPPVKSTLRRVLESDSRVKAYWPCEDEEGADIVASGLAGATPGTFRAGSLNFEENSSFKCSAPLPTSNSCWWTGAVPEYLDTDQEYHINFVFFVPSISTEVTLVRWWNKNSTAPLWQLNIDSSGNLRLQAATFNPGLSLLLDTGLIAFAAENKLLKVGVELYQDGADIDYSIITYEIGATSGSGSGGTLAGQTLGQCSSVEVNPSATLTDVVIGHLNVASPHIGFLDNLDPPNAYNGEAAGDRFIRLCQENDLDYRCFGGVDETSAMGPQLPKTVLELLREVESVDGGLLTEPRDYFGLDYHTLDSLLAQSDLGGVGLTLDYSSADLSEIEPVDDDQNTVNDVTVTREGGSATREELSDGSALSVPRVGRYATSVTLNLETDEQTADHASWRLSVGTVDEARYPRLAVELHRQNFVLDAALTADAKALDVGGKLVVQNLPAWLPPDDLQQLVVGLRERLNTYEHTITYNCIPETPYQTAVFDDSDSRYEVVFSALSAAATSGATSLTVSTPTGAVWGTADLPYDIIVAGERMTVTAVSGSSSPQTFTVTRSVNGVVKAQVVGAEVRLFKRVRYNFGE